MLQALQQEDYIPWDELMGPDAPMATPSQLLSQSLSSGQMQYGQGGPPRQAPSCSEENIPKDRRDQTAPKKSEDRYEALRQRPTMSGEEEWHEALRSCLVDETRRRWLWDEGFTSRASLKLVTKEAVEQIMDRHGGDEQIPIAQVLALNNIVVERVNPPTRCAPNNAGSGGLTLGSSGSQNHSSFASADSLDFQDPTLMMRLQGKRVSYHDITDFVLGHVVEKEHLPLAGRWDNWF